MESKLQPRSTCDICGKRTEIKYVPEGEYYICIDCYKKEEEDNDSHRRLLLCDWCGDSCNLYMLGKEIICCECIIKKKKKNNVLSIAPTRRTK